MASGAAGFAGRARCSAGPARVTAEEQTQEAAPAEPGMCDEFRGPVRSALQTVGEKETQGGRS
jgi:hypothetical protein